MCCVACQYVWMPVCPNFGTEDAPLARTKNMGANEIPTTPFKFSAGVKGGALVYHGIPVPGPRGSGSRLRAFPCQWRCSNAPPSQALWAKRIGYQSRAWCIPGNTAKQTPDTTVSLSVLQKSGNHIRLASGVNGGCIFYHDSGSFL